MQEDDIVATWKMVADKKQKWTLNWWGVREILEICQKCDMIYDMIDFTLIHHHRTYQYAVLLVVASFSSFP